MGEYRDFKDPRYVAWRKKVYARDKYTCQMPGCTNKTHLNAHHIQRWADAPLLRFEISNGVCLCVQCHNKIKDCEQDYEALFQGIVGSKSGNAALRILLLRHEARKEA